MFNEAGKCGVKREPPVSVGMTQSGENGKETEN
jgi:hypothetical protein